MPAPARPAETLAYLLLVVVSFAVLQGLLVVMHEFTHSSMAWLLGDMPSPRGIVWGDPLLMTGWDEGVHYARLFPSGGDPAEAAIGGSPLAVHAAIAALGLAALRRPWMTGRKWLFHLLYWFVVANFMELIAYIVMRPFDPGGDTGHFNRGLGLSPWFLFLGGTLLLLYGLRQLFGTVMPLAQGLFAQGNRLTEWAILLLTAFALFLWGSGLRVVLYVYPDPQWLFGLSGFAAFALFVLLYRPAPAAGRATA